MRHFVFCIDVFIRFGKLNERDTHDDHENDIGYDKDNIRIWQP